MSEKKRAWNVRYAKEKKERVGPRSNYCEKCRKLTARLDGHHPYGQAGKMIMLFVLLCRRCHDWIHSNPNTARAEGWLCDSIKQSNTEAPAVRRARERAEKLWQ